MPNYEKPLGDAVRKARVMLDLTQRSLAEKLGVDERTILNIESYHSNPEMKNLFPLVRTLSSGVGDRSMGHLLSRTKAGRVSFPADTNSAERVQRC